LLIKTYLEQTKIKEGCSSNLSIENQVLLLLEYYQENRTFIYLRVSYGLNESNAYRTVIKLEDILIQLGYCRLAGKKHY